MKYVTSSTILAGDTGLAKNLTPYTTDVLVELGNSMIISGAVTIPNLTVNGNLAVSTELNVTTDLDIGASGSLNIIG